MMKSMRSRARPLNTPMITLKKILYTNSKLGESRMAPSNKSMCQKNRKSATPTKKKESNKRRSSSTSPMLHPLRPVQGHTVMKTMSFTTIVPHSPRLKIQRTSEGKKYS